MLERQQDVQPFILRQVLECDRVVQVPHLLRPYRVLSVHLRRFAVICTPSVGRCSLHIGDLISLISYILLQYTTMLHQFNVAQVFFTTIQLTISGAVL